MKTIELGSEVIVSDPCYEVGTWCQAKISGVSPGKYNVWVETSDKGDDWGIRISKLFAIHSDSKSVTWERTDFDIGVDSGQCGIFSMDSYRNDASAKDVAQAWKDDVQSPGQEWYTRMCRLTWGDESWGMYDKGVVSRSGYGDGSYELYLAKNEKNEIVGFMVDYLLDQDEDEEE